MVETSEKHHFDEEHPTGRLTNADPTGGICLADKDNVATKVFKDLAKTAVKAVLAGSLTSLMRMTTPAYVHSALSYLDTV